MKVKLVYPKIPDSRNCPLKNCIAQVKYDGTCIYISYYPDLGFMDFGTRRDIFPYTVDGINQFIKAHPELNQISNLLEGEGSIYTYLVSLEQYLISHKDYYDKELMIFFEYLGKNSFAGSHNPNDEKQLVLIDIKADEELIPPEQFINDFSNFNMAKVIYTGKYSGQLVEDIRNNKFNLEEGAVIKGMHKGKRIAVKVKTNDYLKKLKISFKEKWADYWE